MIQLLSVVKKLTSSTRLLTKVNNVNYASSSTHPSITFTRLLQINANYNTLKITCWKCHTEITTSLKEFPTSCSKCGRIQKYTNNQIPDYFTLLGQSPNYNVDLTTISTNMKNLQRKLHPDLFSNKEVEEQEVSQSLSSIINQAIGVIQNPIQRGLYLLHLRGITIDLEKQQIKDAEFLSEIMELNEELEGISDASAWKSFRLTNQQKLAKYEKELGEAFHKNNLNEAELILSKMKYFENLQGKLKEIQGKFNVVD